MPVEAQWWVAAQHWSQYGSWIKSEPGASHGISGKTACSYPIDFFSWREKYDSMFLMINKLVGNVASKYLGNDGWTSGGTWVCLQGLRTFSEKRSKRCSPARSSAEVNTWDKILGDKAGSVLWAEVKKQPYNLVISATLWKMISWKWKGSLWVWLLCVNYYKQRGFLFCFRNWWLFHFFLISSLLGLDRG